jgi:mRNA interferase MazF
MLEYIFALLEWCKIAVSLRLKRQKILFKEGEIWWCSIGMNVGIEVFGKGSRFTRPVLIFKKLDSDSFLGIPLTSQPKEGDWYSPIRYDGAESMALLAQARVFDSCRLTKRIGTLDSPNFQAIKAAFGKFYLPENSHPASRAGIGGTSQTFP